MNRIVRNHYPAAKLPEDLREGIPSNAEVTIVVEEESPEDSSSLARKPLTLEEMFTLVKPTFKTSKEVDDHVRAMRDEWDREG